MFFKHNQACERNGVKNVILYVDSGMLSFAEPSGVGQVIKIELFTVETRTFFDSI